MVRSRSCFNDDDCLAGDFDACTNMTVAGKPLYADFKLTDKKQDSKNSGDNSSELGDKPPAEDGQQPSEGDRQPSDKEPSESVTPLRKRRKAPVKDSTVLLNNSEDLLALLSSQSIHVQAKPTDVLPETVLGKRIVYLWEEPPKWYLGTIKSVSKQKLAKDITSDNMIRGQA